MGNTWARGAGTFFVVAGLLLAGSGAGKQDIARAQSTGSGGVDAYRTQLQSKLTTLEAQIVAQQKILDQVKGQDISLQRDIKILDAQIKQAQLSIRARNLVIQQLTSNIKDKEDTIF